MKVFSFIVFFLFVCITSIFPISKEDVAVPNPGDTQIVMLKNGFEYKGVVKEIKEDYFVFNRNGEDIPIYYATVEKITTIAAKDGGKFYSPKYGDFIDPENFKLFIMPTARTTQKTYFSDYELFFYSVGVPVSERVSFNLISIVPISSEAMFGVLGTKVNFYSTPGLDLAVAGNFLFGKNISSTYSGYAIATFGNVDTCLNITGGYTQTNGADNGNITFSVGTIMRLGSHASLVAEYYLNKSTQDSDNFDKPLTCIAYGLRLFGRGAVSADLGFVRPTDTSWDVFPLGFPLVNVTFHF